MKKLIVIAALLVSGSARAEWFAPPTKTDLILQAAFVGVLVVDLGQTIDVGSRCLELNPVLGPCVSRTAAVLWTAGALVGLTLVAWALPQPYRMIWQSVWIGIEVSVVARNFMLGASVRF